MTTSLHDNDVDLACNDEMMYRDRGYTGKDTIAKGNAVIKKR